MTTSNYPLLDCDQCGRPTRDKRDTIKTAVTCYKKPHIPESEIAHARNGLNAWLEDRRKRLGVTV